MFHEVVTYPEGYAGVTFGDLGRKTNHSIIKYMKSVTKFIRHVPLSGLFPWQQLLGEPDRRRGRGSGYIMKDCFNEVAEMIGWMSYNFQDSSILVWRDAASIEDSDWEDESLHQPFFWPDCNDQLPNCTRHPDLFTFRIP